MSEQYRNHLVNEMMTWDGEEAEFTIERTRIDPGLTFSQEAMEHLHDQVLVFIGTRIMRRWDTTQEPPTALTVSIKVVAS